MSGSSRRFSQRNLQRPPSNPVTTPVRRVQGNLPRLLSSPSSTQGRAVNIPNRDGIPNTAVEFDVASSNPTNNFLIGLREIVVKALLIDIEAAGGLSAPSFSLHRICNCKPDIYGPAGSTLRRQVQNKVYKLRQLAPFQYLSVLNYYRVSSGALTRSFRLLDSADFESDESLSEPVTPIRLQRRAVANASPRLQQNQVVAFESPLQRPHRSPLRPPHSAARRLAMNNQQVFFDDFHLDDVSKYSLGNASVLFRHTDSAYAFDLTDVITVDLEHPERNREVMVFTVNDVRTQGNMYNCFTIMLRVDTRDAAVEDRCTAFMVSETEILISYPALEYFFFTDSAARNERLKVGTAYDPQVQLSQDICINDVRRAPQRVIKKLLLRFPEDVTLANVFSQFSFVIPSTMPMDYAETLAFGLPAVKVLTTHMQWMIADLNTHRQATIVAAAATPLDILSANFARIFQATSATTPDAAPVVFNTFVSTSTSHPILPTTTVASMPHNTQPWNTASYSAAMHSNPFAAPQLSRPGAVAAAPMASSVAPAFGAEPRRHGMGAPVVPQYREAARHSNAFAAPQRSRPAVATAPMASSVAPAFGAEPHRHGMSAPVVPQYPEAARHSNAFAAPQRSQPAVATAPMASLVAPAFGAEPHRHGMSTAVVPQYPEAARHSNGFTVTHSHPLATSQMHSVVANSFMSETQFQHVNAIVPAAKEGLPCMPRTTMPVMAAANEFVTHVNTRGHLPTAIAPSAMCCNFPTSSASPLVVVPVMPHVAAAAVTQNAPALASRTTQSHLLMPPICHDACHETLRNIMTENDALESTANITNDVAIRDATKLLSITKQSTMRTIMPEVHYEPTESSVATINVTDARVPKEGILSAGRPILAADRHSDAPEDIGIALNVDTTMRAIVGHVAIADAAANAAMDVPDVCFAIGVAKSTKRISNARGPIEMVRRRVKRPPAIPTPMRKELGSPRKRNCISASATPLLLEDTAHHHSHRRSSPRLRAMVPSSPQNPPGMMKTMNPDEIMEMVAYEFEPVMLNDSEMMDTM